MAKLKTLVANHSMDPVSLTRSIYDLYVAIREQHDRLVSNKESFAKLIGRCDVANEVVRVLNDQEKLRKLTALKNLNG
jgi:hypothetical protein